MSVKALEADLELSVLGAPYGVDRVGHEFHNGTDFGDLPIVPVIHYHGWGANDGARIGWAYKAERNDAGQWYRVVLDKSSDVARKIYSDAKNGLVRASSDALAHLVRPANALKGYQGKIDRWVIGALSLMDAATYETAINPRAIAMQSLKAFYEQLGYSGEATKSGSALNKSNRALVKNIRQLLDELYAQFPESEQTGVLVEPTSSAGVKSKMDDTELGLKIESMIDLKMGIAAKADAERQARSTEEAQAKEREAAAVKAQIDSQLSAKLAELNAAAIKAGRPAIFGETPKAPETSADDVAAKAFMDYVRYGTQSFALKATLNETTAGQGGYLVPIKYSNEIVTALNAASIFRASGAKVLSVADTNSFKVPGLTNTVRAAKTAESAAYDQVEATVTEVAFTPIKYTRVSKVTEELLENSRFDVFSQIIAPDAAVAFSKAENEDFTVGDGSGDPQGVTIGASAGVTAASATAITADEVIDMYHSLGYLHRGNAVWILADATLKLIRKLKDSTNQYLWQPGLAAGQPDRLLGRPVIVNNDMPAATAGLIPIVFADLSYFWIADFGQMGMYRLNELYRANGQVGFQWVKRYDSHVMLTAAVKKLTMAAS